MDYNKLLDEVANSSFELITLKKSDLELILTEAISDRVSEEKIDKMVDMFERRIDGDDDSYINLDDCSFDIMMDNRLSVSDVTLYVSDLGQTLRQLLYNNLIVTE